MRRQAYERRFTIRAATEGDVNAVARLIARNNGPQDALGFIPKTVWSESAAKGTLWVACDLDGNVVGMLECSHHKRDTETYLATLCVSADVRRQGVARGLVDYLAELCRGMGRTAITVHCVEGHVSNEFWRAYGFQDDGLKTGRVRNQQKWRLPL